jgi:hypothetical protein
MALSICGQSGFLSQYPATAQQVSDTSTPETIAAPTAERSEPSGYKEALALYSSGKYVPAAAQLEKILASGQADTATHYLLAGSYLGVKKYKLAADQYQWVAKNAPSGKLKTKSKAEAQKLTNWLAGICPGNCLKKSMPGWAHYPNLDPNLLWMAFRFADAQGGGTKYWSTHHLGEVIEYEGGIPVDKGTCPICHGTGHVTPLK